MFHKITTWLHVLYKKNEGVIVSKTFLSKSLKQMQKPWITGKTHICCYAKAQSRYHEASQTEKKFSFCMNWEIECR